MCLYRGAVARLRWPIEQVAWPSRLTSCAEACSGGVPARFVGAPHGHPGAHPRLEPAVDIVPALSFLLRTVVPDQAEYAYSWRMRESMHELMMGCEQRLCD